MIKKDIEALAVTNQNMRVDLNDLLKEKDAMESKCSIIINKEEITQRCCGLRSEIG
jgi:hypothetical protein